MSDHWLWFGIGFGAVILWLGIRSQAKWDRQEDEKNEAKFNALSARVMKNERAIMKLKEENEA